MDKCTTSTVTKTPADNQYNPSVAAAAAPTPHSYSRTARSPPALLPDDLRWDAFGVGVGAERGVCSLVWVCSCHILIEKISVYRLKENLLHSIF
jgi:hypothetical protein